MKRLLQVHITDKCNLRCKHCYQEGMNRSSVMDIESFALLMNQFDDLLTLPDSEGKVMNITGGEPLIIPNIFDYIDIAINSGVERINLLTNGILFNKDNLLKIKSRDNIIETQVSLEGPEEINDKIRGKGSFKKIIQSIKLAKDLGLYIKVSCTLNDLNYSFVDETIDIVKESGADMIWFDRMTPFNEDIIKGLNTEQFIFAMNKIKNAKIKYATCNDFKILTKRALQFLFCLDEEINGYKCAAIVKNFSIFPDGSVYACPRLPIKLGNFKETSLIDIYHSEKAQELLKIITSIPNECRKCDFKNNCLGGARCITYVNSGCLDKGDINCPIK